MTRGATRLDPGESPDAGSAAPAVASAASVRETGSGSESVAGAMAPTSVSRLSVVGRWRGSLARHRSTSGRSSAGT
jgi:hypothetical protein